MLHALVVIRLIADYNNFSIDCLTKSVTKRRKSGRGILDSFFNCIQGDFNLKFTIIKTDSYKIIPNAVYDYCNYFTYRISLNNVRGHQVNQQFQKSKNLNNVPFLCTKLFQKRGHYSTGDIIQGRTLSKEIWYVRIQGPLYFL